VTDTNKKLSKDPAIVNSSAEKDGWLFKIKVSDEKELEELLNQKDYQNSLGPTQFFGNLLLGKFRSYQEVASTGRGGSFFFKTGDGNFLLSRVYP